MLFNSVLTIYLYCESITLVPPFLIPLTLSTLPMTPPPPSRSVVCTEDPWGRYMRIHVCALCFGKVTRGLSFLIPMPQCQSHMWICHCEHVICLFMENRNKYYEKDIKYETHCLILGQVWKWTKTIDRIMKQISVPNLRQTVLQNFQDCVPVWIRENP